MYDLQKSSNFLSSIPRTSEVINITAGYTGSTDNRCLTIGGKLEEVSFFFFFFVLLNYFGRSMI